MIFRIERTTEAIHVRKPCEAAKWDPRRSCYIVEIQDLGDLLALQRDIGGSIILQEDTLEIYDGYRE